jgi:Flp pilus assembly protein TadD
MGVRISNDHKQIACQGQKLPADLQNETFESQDLFRRAEACIVRGNFEKAEQLLAETIKISPDNPTYISYYGLCVGMLGDLGEGEKHCLRAAKLSSSNPIALVNLGRILLEQGYRKEAREQFSRAYAIDNTHSAAALELSAMGVRRPPVLPFLSRNHPLNVYLGKLRHHILGFKKPGGRKF